MVKLYSHPEDPGSYRFTLRGTREARSPDPVEEAKEMMTQMFGNTWVPPGESVVRCVVRLQSCTITCVPESWDGCCRQRPVLGMPLRVSGILYDPQKNVWGFAISLTRRKVKFH